MNEDTEIGEIHQPVRLIKPEISQYVARCIVPKGNVTKAATKEVEHGGRRYPDKIRLPHYLVLRRG